MSFPSSLGIEDKLKLESWGLPKYILEKYRSKGLHSMFPWQLECLTSGNVLNGGNLIYSAPTSAGKTLIAEILTFQTVLEKKKKVIIILPFVSVVREKMIYFQDLLVGSGIRVEGFMGSYNPPGGFRAVHVAICTIEKANSLINRLLEENNFDNIGCVVVDELHLLGDPHRGYLLELLLTKLKYINKKGLCPPIQIVGMSATLPNLDVLAQWLDATLFKTDFRPIPLVEFMKVNRCIYKTTKLTSSESFEPKFHIDNDPGDVIYLCIDTILNGYSVLVFCPTKNWCETLALQIAGEVKRLGSSNNDLAVEIRKQLNSEAISDTLQQLKNSPVGLESVLGKCVSFGVAYHHAGLTLDERDIIEGGFRRNILRVLVATSTLSSGVNLPARRVIIRSPLFNGRMMDILSYKQMVGRAGRMGKDTAGESYLLCTEEQRSQGLKLVNSELPSVKSCLGHSDLSNSLKRAVLEVVASGLISSYDEVRCYTNCTLLAAYEDSEYISQAVQKCIKYLATKGFIDVKNETEISVSSLAEACLSASMTPDQGLALLAELDKARKCFILDSDLHAVYQVTPFSVSNQWSLDWMKAFSMWEALPTNVQNVGKMVGVDERFLIKAMRGNMNFQANDQAQKIAIHRRFFTALALQDLINEVPLNKVAEKYGCNKGVLQNLQQSASTFSGMVTNFCRKLSWGAMEVVVSQLGQRIQFGAHRDLLDLLRLECMTGAMARGLYNSGITTVSEVAQSSVKQICTAIRKALPYTSSEDPQRGRERRDIYLPGRPGLTELEAAELFVKEARTFLMREMGIDHVNWNDSKLTEVESKTTIPDHTTRIDESQDSLLNLSVSSANFQNLNTGSQNFKIGLEHSIGSTSTQIPIPLDSKNSSEYETLGKSASVNNASQDIETKNVAEDKSCIAEMKPSDVPLAVDQFMLTNEAFRLHLSDDDHRVEEVYRDSISDEDEGNDNMKPSKFSSLLNISNPCIPKLDSTLRSPSSSCSEAEHEVMSEDIVVPASQELLPSQFNLQNKKKVGLSLPSGSGMMKNEGTEVKDSADYKLHFTNLSKAFDSTFGLNSPLEGEKSILKKLNPSIKSSTPFHTPESKTSEKMGDGTFLETKRLGSASSILGLTTGKLDSSFRTPESRFSNVMQERLTNNATIKISPAASELSDADMFADNDAADNKLSYSMLCGINSDKLLDELDSNMGGDSILLASQIIESQKDLSVCHSNLKRSIDDSESNGHPWKIPNKKRCTLSAHKSRAEKSSLEVPSISNYFTENFVLDTQVMNVVDSEPPLIFPAEKNIIELVESPLQSSVSKSVSSKPARNSLTDSYLAEAFQDSFKSSEHGTVLEPRTPDMFESPTTKTINNQGQSKPVPNNGLDQFEIARSSTNIIVDNQLSAISPPKRSSCKSSSASPSKYPAVGVCVVKCSRSPGSPAGGVKKTNPHPHRESSFVVSCKKSLLLPSSSVSQNSSNGTDNIVVNSQIAEPALPLDDLPCAKKLKKTKSETWGKNVSIDMNLITGEEPIPDSAPVASRIRETKYLSGHDNFPAVNNFLEVCENNDKLKQFLKIIQDHKELAFYLETANINTVENKIGMRIMKNPKTEKDPDFHYDKIGIVGMYFCMGNELFHCCLRSSKCICIDAIKTIFQEKYMTVIGFCLSWQLKLLFQCCKISAQCKLWDISVADWLLNPREEKILLKQMAKEHLTPEAISRANLQKSQLASDTVMIWSLKQKLSFILQESGLLNPFEDIEMPIQLLLVYMELSGMPFDQNVATQLWNRTRETMAQLEEQIYLKARRRFNLSSRKDLKNVKESLKIKPEDTKNPILINILNWRKLNSLKTRNLSPLLMTPQMDGRCRGQTSSFTVTGRIVMREPNLQHIPRDFTIDNEAFSLRSAFIAKSGNVIISADYSQLELRILAHFSEDPDLLRSFQNEADVFISIAAKWNNIPVDQVTEDIRHQTKQIIYGIIYGMGDRALGEALGVDPPEAAILAAKFRRSYPGVQRFIENCISDCRKQGFITTLTGRVRRLKDINSPNKSLRAQAERQAVNSTIQGSAADIAKSATVRIESRLKTSIPKRDPVLTPLSASHLILHLHDELMYEVSKEYAEIVKNIVKTEMSNAVKLKVPLPVVVKCGPSWGQLKKV